MSKINSVFNKKRNISNELSLFQDEIISNKLKFYILMDLLVSNQEDSRVVFFIFFGIFYLQIISSFFSNHLGILNITNSFSDNILFNIQKIFRIKDLFKDDYTSFKITEIVIFIIFIILLFHFFISWYFISRKSFYSYNLAFINLYIKIFLYIGYNIILDLSFSNFCMGFDEFNPNFTNVKCHDSTNTEYIIISIMFCIVVLVITLIILTYYYDSFFLSLSYYSKISCNYDYVLFITCFINSAILTQVKYFTTKVFLLFNLVFSIILFTLYIRYFLYYNDTTNTFAGMFHILYIWTSIFSIIFSFVDINEKGVIYLIISILICGFYLIIRRKIVEKIIINTPYHKIDNLYYLLYYCHFIIKKIITIDDEPKYKSLLFGIIQMHIIECPNPSCILKNKEKIFLPISNKWSYRTKNSTDDEIFLNNFIIVVMNYYIVIKKCLVDIYINLSLYYLKKIGNYCQAIYFYKKVSEFVLTYQEEFSFNRLYLKISKALLEKLKPSNEQVSSLELLDVSQYYKYDFLTQNFIDEISNDVNLSLEFWKTFRAPLKDNKKSINFNKIFKLTDQIRISKSKVEHMWNELLSIYNGVNVYFELYSTYVVEINDDDLKKRDLDSLKRKNDNLNENLNQNFYAILFNKSTGIIIANGDKGCEGLIELSNSEIEHIFNYRAGDLKGKNLIMLMPKLFMKEHSKYMHNYFMIGEKKIIDNDNFYSLGKDKDNNIIKIRLAIKLFPVLNKNIFFIGLIVKENIEDIIFMDENFNIQGMSSSLVKKFGINNYIFQESEIPFYVICKKFVNFYNIFLHKTRKDEKNDENNDLINLDFESQNNDDKAKINNLENKNDDNYRNNSDNLEINENIELEYEIKIPNFLFEYSEKTKIKNIKQNILIDEKKEEDDNFIDDQNEEEPLIDDSRIRSKIGYKSSIIFSSIIDNKKKITNAIKKTQKDRETPNPTSTPTPTPTPTPTFDQTPTPDGKESRSKKKKIKNEEKDNYNSIIKKYVKLFENFYFSELENLIDNYNLNSSIEYKFNFTFDRYKYGNNHMAYIVRCIDNKNDAGKSEEETINDVDPKGVRYKKEKIEAIKPLYELFPSEKKELKEQTDNFLKLSLENYTLQKALQACKDDIKEMSIAYGQKEDIIIKDENSSQIAQSGFDSGLVKKNRIEEIKSNLLVNIENFYILKYIKGIIILIGLFTSIFGCIYIVLFLKLYKILKDVSLLNVKLFQNCLWTTEIVSIFISLKTLNINYFNSDFIFNNYKEKEDDNNLDYYDRMKEFAKILYFDLLYANEALEKDISNYLNKDDLMSLYWDRIDISYNKDNYHKYKNKIDTETFPMAMAQLLSNCISFLSNDNFNITEEAKKNYNNLSLKDKIEEDIYLEYILYIIIENSYDNILPNHLKKITNIPEILQKYNENKKFPPIISIIIYSCIMIILCILYNVLLCLTNRSLTGGLIKVTKIRLEQVEETIKTIEAFNMNLKSLRDRDFKSEQEFDLKNIEENNQKIKDNQDNQDNISKNNDNKNSAISSLGFNTDSKKIIPLKTLKYSYILIVYIVCILIALLIPIYIYTTKMVKNTNDLLLVEIYIFGNLIKASIETVEIKCFMSNCNNKNNLNYSEIADTKLMLDIIMGVNAFEKVSNFYYNNFLKNACGSAIDNKTNPIEYLNCLKDDLIISGNNTDSLIRLISDVVDNIKKEYYIQIEKEGENKNIEKIKLSLFGTDYFQLMEKIYYKYILPVGNKFADITTSDLNYFLNNNRTLIILFILLLIVLIIIYCIFLGITLIRRLIHYLSVSRCIMKIIPTSVIINTQELESWIENKYSF